MAVPKTLTIRTLEGETDIEFPEIDETLSSSNMAADAKVTGDRLALLCDEIPDTIQAYTFDSLGAVTAVTHTKNTVVVRTDTFTYGENTITEVRTLSTGESLTISTNLNTLVTTITYSDGGA